MDNNIRGVSDESKELARQVQIRFAEFVNDKGLAAVANKSGYHYSALRNSAIGKYNPSLETIFQVKLAYGDEFDDVYVFTGKKLKAEDVVSVTEDTEIKQYDQSETRIIALEEKIIEKEQLIQDLKQDKLFLQSIINKN